MISFTHIADDNDQPTERGTYRRIVEYWAAYGTSKGRPCMIWAEICCPGCGKVGLVGSNHTVATDGTVSPSDVCPFAPCTFHEFIKLEGWDRPATPRREPDWRLAAGIPRRICIDRMTPAELAIRAAVEAVEMVGADPRLTEAVILLGEAKDRLADFIDGIP